MEEKKKSKLKIIIPIVIIAIVVLAVVGIVVLRNNGGTLGKMSKEKMLEVAQEITESDIIKDFSINEKNAKEKYIGNIYKYKGTIQQIGDNYVSLDTTSNHTSECKIIYLSEKELKEVSKGQSITVIGEITKISSAYNKVVTFEMENAFIEGF